jgi:eukaryotic-like serine/threonine-protein kinase
VTVIVGTRLGPYEILSALGAGGMGEVYKARDTRLDRTVAIKILPDTLAGDSQFRDRFDREARTISQLDHAHICALYDVGEERGTAYLVMQYLEGETLADRLTKGALPLDQALQVAIQIADALATAHKAGIVHRDLKPGNIMLTKSGAKLLDFGLAKTGVATVSGTNLSMLPTTPPITQQGSILGTFQYMAPEQIEGQEADARTDIFAFGAVVYEMLTGKKAFEGKSQASLIGAIMHAEPTPISTLQALTPPALDRIVRHCLDKRPEQRFQSATDVAFALDTLSGVSEGTPALDSRAVPATRRAGTLAWKFVAAGATVIALVAAPLAVVHWRESPSVPQTVRFLLDLPEKTSFPPASIASISISPDARHIAFVTGGGGTTQLWVRALDDTIPHAVPGAEGLQNQMLT